MHPDNEPINPIDLRTGTLFITDLATGEETPLGPVTDINETIVPDPISPDAVHWINKAPEATFTIRIPNKKMNRKKFVKQLMANRVPRNVANSMAEIARAHSNPYSWAWLVINFGGFLPWED